MNFLANIRLSVLILAICGLLFTVILVLFTLLFNIISLEDEKKVANDNRVELIQNANRFMGGSATLTNTVRAYSTTGNIAYYNEYMDELNKHKNRDIALEIMNKIGISKKESDLISQMSKLSNILVPLEVNAMKSVEEGNLAEAQKYVYGQEYNTQINKIGELRGKFLQELNDRQNNLVANAENSVSTNIKIMMWIFLFTLALQVLTYVAFRRKIIIPIQIFQTGLENFFKYLNGETKKVEQITITTRDEFGVMTKVINENISRTTRILEEDQALINDVKRVVERVKEGSLDNSITKETSNKSLQELKEIFNEMIRILEKNIHSDINELTNVLEKFKNRDFATNIKNPKGTFAIIINELSSNINKMLCDNLANGNRLNESASGLKRNMDKLSTGSNEQAASLEETAAALEEITSTIKQTSSNIANMTQYTQDLNKSIQLGQKLAEQTSVSMDEINEQTGLIADAITAIDQIAFQTNILSLNAAVEAATAGEAGKGFAVVAQEVRNLASRSADAAREIKDIVENATSKANAGKERSDNMIEGYNQLAHKVKQTTDLIFEISTASKEQTAGITQINDAVGQLDKATQENANIANSISAVVNETSKMAVTVIEEVNKSKFSENYI